MPVSENNKKKVIPVNIPRPSMFGSSDADGLMPVIDKEQIVRDPDMAPPPRPEASLWVDMQLGFYAWCCSCLSHFAVNRQGHLRDQQLGSTAHDDSGDNLRNMAGVVKVLPDNNDSNDLLGACLNSGDSPDDIVSLAGTIGIVSRVNVSFASEKPGPVFSQSGFYLNTISKQLSRSQTDSDLHHYQQDEQQDESLGLVQRHSDSEFNYPMFMKGSVFIVDDSQPQITMFNRVFNNLSKEYNEKLLQDNPDVTNHSHESQHSSRSLGMDGVQIIKVEPGSTRDWLIKEITERCCCVKHGRASVLLIDQQMGLGMHGDNLIDDFQGTSVICDLINNGYLRLDHQMVFNHSDTPESALKGIYQYVQTGKLSAFDQLFFVVSKHDAKQSGKNQFLALLQSGALTPSIARQLARIQFDIAREHFATNPTSEQIKDFYKDNCSFETVWEKYQQQLLNKHSSDEFVCNAPSF